MSDSYSNEDTIRYNRHASRFIGILTLYSYDMSDKKELGLLKTSEIIKKSYLTKDIFDLNLTDEQIKEINLYPPDDIFLENLMSLIEIRNTEIENLIKSSLIKKWNFDRLDRVIKAILKLSALELLYNQDIPTNIIIDEYVSLTKTFYENSETGFVNKVVDTMAKLARPS